MLQGTASSVGKSILTAILCRILKQDGYSVAPFKSQNMSSKSILIEDNKEISIAQAIQAEAAMIEPNESMNPILLKPMSDIGSLVVLNGLPYKVMTASEYHKMKLELKWAIKEAYNKLAQRFDIIVIEGAGSPAEINLRDNDIVNMGLAELVDAPVILIGDIDRGGVFASIYGTLMLMPERERNRVKGFIINKFRGDVELLKPGIKMIEELVDKPCFGVVPYMQVDLEEEDSLIVKNDYKEWQNPTMSMDMKQEEPSLNLQREYRELRNREFERLAHIVRNSIDIDKIKEIMRL
jgi:adenosylcobyric acid synthase|nr:cobyric acid synthase [Proteiniborus sp. DW1]